MSQFDAKMTELADAIKAKNNNITGKLSVQGMIDAVGGIPIGNDEYNAAVTFGYWTADGKFQALDLSGDAPVDSGDPIAVDAVMFNTGKPAPEHLGGRGMQFYLCTGYTGVIEKIVITAGAIYDEMEEPVSLVGEYTIIDPAAVGTARRWHCPQTTASGDYQAYNYGVTIGCLEVESGNWDENDNPIFEKYWAIAPGTYIDEWSYWLSTQTEGLESPFLVQDWSGDGGTIVTAPVLTSDVADAAPYGPSGWKGSPIVMTDKPVFFSYGAGVKSANGYWKQTKGAGLSPEAEWKMIGSDAIIKNLNPGGSYTYWGIWATNSDGYYGQIYDTNNSSSAAGEIKHPALLGWASGSSAYNSVPTFVYSESGGYSPAKSVVSGLSFAEKLPEIGGFYNADATIKAEKFFPA